VTAGAKLDPRNAERLVSERDLELIIDTTPALIWSAHASGETESVNRHFLDYVGLSLEELQGSGWMIAFHPDDKAGLEGIWKGLVETGTAGQAEARLRRHDGEYRWFLLRVNPLRDASGAVVKWFGVNTDIEDRKRAEEALAASERNLRQIINTIPAFVWCNSAEGPNEFLNQRWHDYTGISPEDARGNGWQAALHPDDLPRLMKKWLGMLASGDSGEVEGRLRRFDGVYRWFVFQTEPLRDATGKITKWYGTNTDIEDRKQAEAELRQAYNSFADAQRLSKTGSFITNLAADDHNWSDEAHRIFEFERGTKITVKRIRDIVHLEDLPMFDSVIESGVAGVDVDFVFRIVTPRGAVKHIRGLAHVMEQVAGQPLFVGALQDVTESKIAEDALRRSEAFLAHGQAVSETGSFLWNLETGHIRWSNQMYRIFEFEAGSPVTLDRIASRVHPQDLPMMDDMVARAQTSRDSEFGHRLLMPDGSIKYLHFVAQAMRDNEGRRECMGSVQDITARRLAEETLDKVRSELAHAARAMSLGVLTASLAHEVNQPLAGIITNASTCLRMLTADPPNISGALDTARRTIRDGNRASDVVARLRGLFGKKEFATEVVDLNEATREVVALSSHELQRYRIVVSSELGEHPLHIVGDRVQLQQVILNLVLNASDALKVIEDRPRQIFIRTTDNGSGSACLSVRDTGTGIAAEAVDKLFDAFFTTKPDGMGIGLSVSRSIIERHHGRLWASQNTGPGATFSFSVPCHASQ
jgi:PAS domain S-box-containing protein